MTTRRTRATAELDSLEGSPAEVEVLDSQTLPAGAGATEEFSPEMLDRINATIDRRMAERLAQQQQLLPQPQLPQVPKLNSMRGRKPQPYYGKNRAEFDEFTEICESAFLSALWGPEDHAPKIGFASSFFCGTPLTTWKGYKRDHPIITLTWDEFKDHLLTQLGDKANVESNAFDQWYNAKQKPNQTIQSYVAYLDSIASHLSTPPSDLDRLQKLRSSIRDSIQATIQAQVTQPLTRADLVAQAQRIEENENARSRHRDNDRSSRDYRDGGSSGGPQRSQGKNRPEYRHNPIRKRDDKDSKPRDNDNKNTNRPKLSPEEFERRKKKRLCFYCGKGNHVSKECSKREKEEKEKKGNTSSVTTTKN